MVLQHRHVILSGILGATASAIAKLALGTGSDALLHQWFTGVCQEHILPQDGTEFDEWLVQRVNRFLGHLMIKHNIVLMDKWKQCQLAIADLAVQLRIVEVDYCAAFELVPRILCLVLVIVCNVWMVAYFVKGIVSSGSVAGTTLASAANFSASALMGAVIWKERFSDTWWMGFLSVVLGVVLLSTVQPRDDVPKTSNGRFTTSANTITTTVSRSSASASTSTRSHRTKPSTKAAPSSFLPKIFTGKSNSASASKPSTSGSSSYAKKAKPSFFGRKPTKIPRSIIVDRSFCNECPLCEGQLFDLATGESPMAIADMSPNCFHLTHAKCLKQSGHGTPTSGGGNNIASTLKASASKAGCPVCGKSISMWISSKQAAHFAAFWIDRVEACLQAMGPAKGDMPRPAQQIRDMLQQDQTLTKEQKRYIDDDPTGLGKGLASALEWGGYVDYNQCPKGQIGWSKHLVSRGIWCYNAKRDDLWLWEWNDRHPRQRCEGCQFLDRSLPIACDGCQGSCQAAFYCSERCKKRDWQRHKMVCEEWKQYGPNGSAAQ